MGISGYRLNIRPIVFDARAIAGCTILNDVTARDWQYRSQQWLQGKTFESNTPVGPWLDTDIDQDGTPELAISTEVDGVLVQSA